MLARRLARRPAVAAALTAGEISVDHARVVAQSLDELASADDTLAAEAEAPLLAAARQLDPARLRREIAHARHALTPEASAVAEESRHQRRHLDVATTFEGMVAISGLLTPEGGELLMTALTPLSGAARPEDTRTPGQRRADARSSSSATVASTTPVFPRSRASARISPSSSPSRRSLALRQPDSAP